MSCKVGSEIGQQDTGLVRSWFARITYGCYWYHHPLSTKPMLTADGGMERDTFEKLKEIGE